MAEMLEEETLSHPPQFSSASANDVRNTQTDQLFNIEEGQDEFSSTYIFGNEDHTFGNSLRHVLMQRRETQFCGYSIPHPYDPKLNMRLQVSSEKSSNEVSNISLPLQDPCKKSNIYFPFLFYVSF